MVDKLPSPQTKKEPDFLIPPRKKQPQAVNRLTIALLKPYFESHGG